MMVRYVQMYRSQHAPTATPLRIVNRSLRFHCWICDATNTYTIPLDRDSAEAKSMLERDTVWDSQIFGSHSLNHTRGYRQLLPTLNVAAVLEVPWNNYSVGHPFSMFEVMSSEARQHLTHPSRVPNGCLVQMREGEHRSYSTTRAGEIAVRALNHYVLPEENAIEFPVTLANASYAVHGQAPSHMPHCGALVNIGLAVPTLSCIACMTYSGGGVQHHQIAVSAWDQHRSSPDHGRRELRLLRGLCSADCPPLEGYARDPAVLAYFQLLRHDDASYAEALHHAFYIYNMLERYFYSIGLNAAWTAGTPSLASMAADRALLVGKRHVGRPLKWEGAERWDRARTAAAAAKAEKRTSQAENKEPLEVTLAGDTEFMLGMSAARRARLSAMLRVQDASDRADVLVAEAAAFELSFGADPLLTVLPGLGDLYGLHAAVEGLSGMSAFDHEDEGKHTKGVKRSHE